MVTFMTLPYEIRVRILYHLHNEITRYGPAKLSLKGTEDCPAGCIDRYYPYFCGRIEQLRTRNCLSSQLLRCNRQIHDEASKVLYGSQPVRLNQGGKQPMILIVSHGPYLLSLGMKSRRYVPKGPRHLGRYYRHIQDLEITTVTQVDFESWGHYTKKKLGPIREDDGMAVRDCVSNLVNLGTLRNIHVYIDVNDGWFADPRDCLDEDDDDGIVTPVPTKWAPDRKWEELSTEGQGRSSHSQESPEHLTFWIEWNDWIGETFDPEPELFLNCDSRCRRLVGPRANSLSSYCSFKSPVSGDAVVNVIS